eukprot:365985-Chlamydomonas_euryale.AAC.11
MACVISQQTQPVRAHVPRHIRHVLSVRICAQAHPSRAASYAATHVQHARAHPAWQRRRPMQLMRLRLYLCRCHAPPASAHAPCRCLHPRRTSNKYLNNPHAPLRSCHAGARCPRTLGAYAPCKILNAHHCPAAMQLRACHARKCVCTMHVHVHGHNHAPAQ